MSPYIEREEEVVIHAYLASVSYTLGHLSPSYPNTLVGCGSDGPKDCCSLCLGLLDLGTVRFSKSNKLIDSGRET